MIKAPFLAALVIPETIETGVEIAKAHGQATTRRVNARYTHSFRGALKARVGTIATSAAKDITEGV